MSPEPSHNDQSDHLQTRNTMLSELASETGVDLGDLQSTVANLFLARNLRSAVEAFESSQDPSFRTSVATDVRNDMRNLFRQHPEYNPAACRAIANKADQVDKGSGDGSTWLMQLATTHDEWPEVPSVVERFGEFEADVLSSEVQDVSTFDQYTKTLCAEKAFTTQVGTEGTPDRAQDYLSHLEANLMAWDDKHHNKPWIEADHTQIGSDILPHFLAKQRARFEGLRDPPYRPPSSAEYDQTLIHQCPGYEKFSSAVNEQLGLPRSHTTWTGQAVADWVGSVAQGYSPEGGSGDNVGSSDE